jgi:hypothetical protein
LKCGISTVSTHSVLFNGVNTESRPTHIFTIRKNPVELERGNVFIVYDGRYFRVMGRTINNEDPYFIDIQTVERGITSLSSNEA